MSLDRSGSNPSPSGEESSAGSVTVVGAGYVGLPVAVTFAEHGFEVLVRDTDPERVDAINEGRSYLSDVDQRRVEQQVEAGRLRAMGSREVLGRVDAIIVCVPTPLDEHREPDTSIIEDAARDVAAELRPGQLVSLESTTYPGTTEELVRPILETSGLDVGEDVHLVYSPERVDPGNERYTIENTPKLVGGVTEACLHRGVALYESVAKEVVPVSSPRVAEATKLLENIYRSVNIALVNELKMTFDRMGIDIWEVIEAAKTKPFGYHPFYPGPGLGGHCIPIDPFYLAWKGREFDSSTRFIELAGEINTRMPEYVYSKIVGALNDEAKPVRGSSVLLLGVAYKPDVDDTRESPALKLFEQLQDHGADIRFHDPHVDRITINGRSIPRAGGSQLTDDHLQEADCVVVVTDHSAYDFERIRDVSNLVVDSRNAVRGAAHVYQA